MEKLFRNLHLNVRTTALGKQASFGSPPFSLFRPFEGISLFVTVFDVNDQSLASFSPRNSNLNLMPAGGKNMFSNWHKFPIFFPGAAEAAHTELVGSSVLPD